MSPWEFASSLGSCPELRPTHAYRKVTVEYQAPAAASNRDVEPARAERLAASGIVERGHGRP